MKRASGVSSVKLPAAGRTGVVLGALPDGLGPGLTGNHVSVETRTGVSGSQSGRGRFDASRFLVASEWLTPVSVVVRPQGELDLDSAPDLRRELFGAIETGATAVLVDLETTTFIDSMIIGVLLGAARRLRQCGGELRIACADPNITRIFEITLLDRVFAMYPSREAALGSSAVDR